MADTSRDIIETLQDLLERERSALLSGKHDQLLRLMPLKETALTQLRNVGGAAPEAIDALRRAMERNQQLVQSALDGVRSAVDKLARAQNARGRVVTYDEKGSRTSLPTTSRRQVERRA